MVLWARPTPGSQLALSHHLGHHAFVTNRPGELVEIEADHRRNAVFEQRVAKLNSAGLHIYRREGPWPTPPGWPWPGALPRSGDGCVPTSGPTCVSGMPVDRELLSGCGYRCRAASRGGVWARWWCAREDGEWTAIR